MSYCRFSTDDFQCDVYCYASGYGYETMVAGNQVVWKVPLPPPVADADDWDADMHRFAKVCELMRDESTHERKPIGLPYDGQSFRDDTIEDFAARLTMLKDAGYRVPDGLIEDIQADQPLDKANAD